jgi:hypothetical protein
MPDLLVTARAVQPQEHAKKAQEVPQATQPVLRQYRVGDTILLRTGLTLKVAPGGSKSIGLLRSRVPAATTAFVLDLEFAGGKLVKDAICDFEFGKTAEDKSSAILLMVGDKKIAPEDPVAASVKGVSVRDKLGKRHFITWLQEGKATIGFLFGLTDAQLNEKKALHFRFGMEHEEDYSFVIDLN